MTKKIFAVVLAAGKGTRMKSSKHKSVHQVNGTPMIKKIHSTLEEMKVDRCIYVLGHKKEEILDCIPGCEFTVQREQLGTAHAVLQANMLLEDEPGIVLVMCGDTPLLRAEVLQNMIDFHTEKGCAATVLTTKVPEPYGYGRIVKDSTDAILRIVEEKEAKPREKRIKEINTGVYCFNSDLLWKYLVQVDNNNSKEEYYLTDMVEILNEEGFEVGAYFTEEYKDTIGVNTKKQLATASETLRARKLDELMESGVEIVDPGCTYIEDCVMIEPGAVIHPNVYIQGKSYIGTGTEVYGSTRIHNSRIGENCTVEASVIKQSSVGDNTIIGPFAHLRPESNVGNNCKAGAFVEMKKSVMHNGAQAAHLSYIGNAEVGTGSNIGAGTVTCNYDGVNKHDTKIGEHVFIGSGAKLIAPIEVGDNAIIGAGSVITDNVPADALAIARERQTVKEDWVKKNWFKKDKK